MTKRMLIASAVVMGRGCSQFKTTDLDLSWVPQILFYNNNKFVVHSIWKFHCMQYKTIKSLIVGMANESWV
jgi:hypothetical protein